MESEGGGKSNKEINRIVGKEKVTIKLRDSMD